MLVSMCQINTTPNDFVGNCLKIKDGIRQAVKSKSNIVIFPELTIPGYSVKDLVYTNNFIENNLSALKEICDFSNDITSDITCKDMHIVVGYIGKNTNGVGKPFTNMAAVIKNGHVIATYQKHLLPFYDVFDEGRYFEPGTELTVIEIEGEKFGITICEDVWNDKGQDDYSYEDNPLSSYRKLGIRNIINLSSSPYAAGKPWTRYVMLGKVTEETNMTMFYCNQYGGQDELVFDGKSCVMRGGRLLQLAHTKLDPKIGSSEIVVMTFDTMLGGGFVDFNKEAENDHYKMTLLGLHDYVFKSGFKNVVLGSSGGIDSALVAALACQAIGPENVHCIMMPSIYSSEGSVADAKQLHKNLGCQEHLVTIKHEDLMHHINCSLGFEQAKLSTHSQNLEYKQLKDYNTVADENLQARMRGQIVMHYSNATGALPLTTGNKTELAVGYCTLYGDMNGGFNPIGDLYKMQVYEMSRKINNLNGKEIIPIAIIDKAPSAELKPGQTDEASLLPYPILDRIVQVFIENKINDLEEFISVIKKSNVNTIDSILKWYANKEEALKNYNRIKKLIYNAEFKRRQSAPIIKLSRVAFGTGRRIPIVKGTIK